MTLAKQTWTPVSVHVMIARFLQAERARFIVGVPHWRTGDLIDVPDTSDARQNAERMRLLYQGRRHLLGEVPPDTKWFEVAYLRPKHVGSLCVIGRCGQADDVASGDVFEIAERCGTPLRGLPADWGPIILWGHSKESSLTILDGNHRLLAWASSQRYEFAISVCVGLSSSFCRWHRADPDVPLLHDLWR